MVRARQPVSVGSSDLFFSNKPGWVLENGSVRCLSLVLGELSKVESVVRNAEEAGS